MSKAKTIFFIVGFS